MKKALDVLNCAASGQVEFEFRCPMGWAAMTPTEDARKRYCDHCERSVFWCHNANEAGLRADQGECIAVPGWLAEGVREDRREGVIIIGMPRSKRERLAEVVEARLEEEGGPA